LPNCAPRHEIHRCPDGSGPPVRSVRDPSDRSRRHSRKAAPILVGHYGSVVKRALQHHRPPASGRAVLVNHNISTRPSPLRPRVEREGPRTGGCGGRARTAGRPLTLPSPPPPRGRGVLMRVVREKLLFLSEESAGAADSRGGALYNKSPHAWQRGPSHGVRGPLGSRATAGLLLLSSGRASAKCLKSHSSASHLVVGGGCSAVGEGLRFTMWWRL